MRFSRRQFLNSVVAGGDRRDSVPRATFGASAPQPAAGGDEIRGRAPQRRHLHRARRHYRWLATPEGAIAVDSQFLDTAPACIEGLSRSPQRA